MIKRYALHLKPTTGVAPRAQQMQARHRHPRLRAAAVNGDATAQNIMGAAYEDGNGVAQGYAQALHWYELAAAQNNAKSLFNLGLFHQKNHPGDSGDGVDLNAAARYFQPATELGCSRAMYERARMHAAGQGGA